MNIRIKRFDKSIPLPEYKTSGAAAFDLSARVEVTIPAHTVGYVPLNVAIEVPEGYFVMLAARSSLHKRGLIPANGFGVVDADYCGDADEYVGALYNFSDADVVVAKGDRIMQCIVTPFERVEFNEIESMEKETRGGFGSTGTK